jgi:hypothetical protein
MKKKRITTPRTKTPPGKPAETRGDFSSGSITTVLDAPGSALDASPLPRMFRSSLDTIKPDKCPLTGVKPSVKGLREINASGSSQYSRGQMESVLNSGRVRTPLMVIDRRQESHGFVHVQPALYGETEIAIGWFAERDWMNVGKGLPSIEVDERQRLTAAARTRHLLVNWVKTKTAEDGICTADAHTVNPSAIASEREVVEKLGQTYLRLPTTDHTRPRDAEVDEFVRFASKLTRDTWLHFHCRGGDGRTTTFMVMHDIMCNAPAVSVDDIVCRQFLLGGADLDEATRDRRDPKKRASFAFPFAIERRDFVSDFYEYVRAAKPGRYALTWSAWIAGRLEPGRRRTRRAPARRAR